MNRRNARPRLDLVIPVFNEQDVIEVLVSQLCAQFSSKNLTDAGLSSVRYIFVDDGSADETAALVRDKIRSGIPALLIRLSRNFGHQAALSAGLDAADAELVACMDADLQDPPELVYAMVERWRDGCDVVYGQRRTRRERALKRAGYWLFYRVLQSLSDIPIPRDSGDFCLMDQKVVTALRALPEKLRFIRVLRAWVGFSQAAVPFDRPARKAGAPKYDWRGLYRLATDGIAAASIRPLQLAQVVSFGFFLLAMVFLSLLGFALFLAPEAPTPPFELIALLLLMLGNASLALCIYILGAYVGRTYLEVKGRPSYLVMERIGQRQEDGDEADKPRVGAHEKED